MATEMSTESSTKPDDKDVAENWEKMVETIPGDVESKTAAERALNQEEIDSLLGFRLDDINFADQNGLRAIIDSAMVSYERLPMLEIVFDRLVRLMTT